MSLNLSKRRRLKIFLRKTWLHYALLCTFLHGFRLRSYFERKRLSLKALTPRDLETFFRYERQQEEATVQQLLDWHRELTDALQYAVDSNWLKANPVKTVDPCLDNSPVLFNDFLMDWLKMMKSRVAITTYANYEIVITRRR